MFEKRRKSTVFFRTNFPHRIGVMAARGLLQNPALYGGYSKTPIECVMDWLDICSQLGIPFFTVHQRMFL